MENNQAVQRYEAVHWGAGFLLILMAGVVPIYLPYGLDFLCLWVADHGLLNGFRIYDMAGQWELIEQSRGIRIERAPAFPYPPWYIMLTAFLGWMPPEVASRIWFALNLLMLVEAVRCILPSCSWSRQAFLTAMVLLYVPTFFLLYVGQFTLPLLLGLAFFRTGCREDRLPLRVAGLFLMTFKPHLGLVPFLLSVGWMLFSGRQWLKTVLWTAGILGLFCAAAYGIDANWISDYLVLAGQFASDTQFSMACPSCVSFAVSVTLGGDAVLLRLAMIVFGLLLWAAWQGAFMLRQHGRGSLAGLDACMCTAVLLSLLFSPFTKTYDYVLLIFPLLVLLNTLGSVAGGVILAICCLSSYSMAWLGAAGKPSLWLSAILLASVTVFVAAFPLREWRIRHRAIGANK